MTLHKGLRLKLARQAVHLSQKALGEQLGVKQAFLSRVERGLNEGTVSFWREAARLLEVPLNYLLDDNPDGEVNEPPQVTRLAILADYTRPQGLRDLALDDQLCDILQIRDSEWSQLAAVPFLKAVGKDGFLQLLITLRSINAPSQQIDEP